MCMHMCMCMHNMHMSMHMLHRYKYIESKDDNKVRRQALSLRKAELNTIGWLRAPARPAAWHQHSARA